MLEDGGPASPSNFWQISYPNFKQGGGTDYAHRITTGPPDFWKVRRLWTVNWVGMTKKWVQFRVQAEI